MDCLTSLFAGNSSKPIVINIKQMYSIFLKNYEKYLNEFQNLFHLLKKCLIPILFSFFSFLRNSLIPIQMLTTLPIKKKKLLTTLTKPTKKRNKQSTNDTRRRKRGVQQHTMRYAMLCCHSPPGLYLSPIPSEQKPIDSLILSQN